MRKPSEKESNVVGLRGDYRSEVVSQEVLRELEHLQRLEWIASRQAALASERLRSALAQGATIEEGALYYDRELKMVRSRKQAAGGEK